MKEPKKVNSPIPCKYFATCFNMVSLSETKIGAMCVLYEMIPYLSITDQEERHPSNGLTPTDCLTFCYCYLVYLITI